MYLPLKLLCNESFDINDVEKMEDIKKDFQSRQFVLRDNTTIIDNVERIDIKNIVEGVLIVHATWSGQSLMNCIKTVQKLYGIEYNGQIQIIDIESMTPGFQKSVLGELCQGWGEIFVIHQGQISEKFLGKDSFTDFKTYYKRQ